MNEIKTIVTGATGMAGEGVLHVCLQHPGIKEVLVIGRKNSGIKPTRLKEIVLPDISDLSKERHYYFSRRCG